MFTKKFWRIAIEYAFKSVAQTALALWGISKLNEGVELTTEALCMVLIGVFILSIVTSVATARIKNGYHE